MGMNDASDGSLPAIDKHFFEENGGQSLNTTYVAGVLAAAQLTPVTASAITGLSINKMVNDIGPHVAVAAFEKMPKPRLERADNTGLPAFLANNNSLGR